MAEGLQRMLEHVAYTVAPHLDARVELAVAIAVGAFLLLLFAALIVMPGRMRIAVAPVPLGARPRRLSAVRHPLRGRRVRPTVRARAPSAMV